MAVDEFEWKYKRYDLDVPDKETLRQNIRRMIEDFKAKGGRVKYAKDNDSVFVKGKFRKERVKLQAMSSQVLSEDENLLLWLHHYQGKTYKQIAKIMHKPASSLMMKASRARAKKKFGFTIYRNGRKRRANE
jgi:DNA-directed RNA polymerase specialized sigma24 family protein